MLISLVTLFALTLLFPAKNLCAQDLANADAKPFSFEQSAHPQKVNDETYSQPDLDAGQQPAHFKDFKTFVGNHLVYPKLARENSVEGRVELMLLVSAEGKILSAKVVKSLGFGCDEAALAVVGEMPDWSPATNFGIPVKSKNIVAFDFRLQ
mgnify:CR=1 FL=1